jgi:hypothetical protein
MSLFKIIKNPLFIFQLELASSKDVIAAARYGAIA